MILDAAILDSIRALLGVDADTLPDDLLTGDLLGTRIIRDVTATVGLPAYADRTPDEQARMRSAVAYRIAAAALGSGALRESMAVTQESFGQQYRVSYAANDTASWIADLEAKAAHELAPLLPEVSVSHFRLARGRRGA